jgi:hypothetical protein
MNYGEAKQTALGLLENYPDYYKVMKYIGSNEEFIAITYTQPSDEELEMRRKDHGHFVWDMLIKRKEIEYRQFYMDIRNRPVKAPPRKIPISKVTRDQLSYVLQQQLFITLHPGEM